MKVLVTGAGGFLGGALTWRLIARGDDVVTAQRGDYPQLDDIGADVVRGDLADAAICRAAVAGCDAVIHVAAKAGVWGSLASYIAANVTPTVNLLNACREANVTRFVYTSSPSVTFAGVDEEGVDESAPYPSRYLAHYPQTKAMAERAVLQANGSETADGGFLATTSLRPHLIWGPGDRHLTPRILDRAKRGKLKLVGRGDNLVDSTYIDNAVAAHLLAVDQLQEKGIDAPAAGRAYFISNDEPMAMRELINRILEAGGMPAVRRSVPPTLAYGVGAVLEVVYKLLGRTREPVMTRFVAKQLSTCHWYDLSAAMKDLRYRPAVSIDEGMRRLKISLEGTVQKSRQAASEGLSPASSEESPGERPSDA